MPQLGRELGRGMRAQTDVGASSPQDMCPVHVDSRADSSIRAQICGNASILIPLGLSLPYLWRLLQCLRVYNDTGARPQLFNALKYSTAFPVIILSSIKYQASTRACRAPACALAKLRHGPLRPTHGGCILAAHCTAWPPQSRLSVLAWELAHRKQLHA